MNKQELLQIMQLLSALESWGFCQQKMFPDYLHERLSETLSRLEQEILK